MYDRLTILSVFLIPLGLCGFMLLLTANALVISEESRWLCLVLGFVLMAPSAVLGAILARKHETEQKEQEDREGDV